MPLMHLRLARSAAFYVSLFGTVALVLSCSGEPTKPRLTGHTTESGLRYVDLVCGTGPAPEAGDSVAVDFTAWLDDGTKIDSSVDCGDPFEFIIGVGHVIRGFDEGVLGMRVGGKRRLVIPPDLAYGDRGYPPLIPPNSTLVFEVELLAVIPSPPPERRTATWGQVDRISRLGLGRYCLRNRPHNDAVEQAVPAVRPWREGVEKSAPLGHPTVSRWAPPLTAGVMTSVQVSDKRPKCTSRSVRDWEAP